MRTDDRLCRNVKSSIFFLFPLPRTKQNAVRDQVGGLSVVEEEDSGRRTKARFPEGARGKPIHLSVVITRERERERKRERERDTEGERESVWGQPGERQTTFVFVSLRDRWRERE